MGRKRTTEAILATDPEPQASQFIARVITTRGQNLYEVANAEGIHLLVELPPKFRSLVWVKRGSYVIADSTQMADRDNKIEGEIVHVLLAAHIKNLKKKNIWPAQFDLLQEATTSPGSASPSNSDNNNDLVANTNRRQYESSDDDD